MYLLKIQAEWMVLVSRAVALLVLPCASLPPRPLVQVLLLSSVVEG